MDLEAVFVVPPTAGALRFGLAVLASPDGLVNATVIRINVSAPDAAGPSRAKSASCSLRRALLTLKVNPGSLYPAVRELKIAACELQQEERGLQRPLQATARELSPPPSGTRPIRHRRRRRRRALDRRKRSAA